MSNKYIYGFHAIESLIQINPQKLKRLFIAATRGDQRVQELFNKLHQANLANIEINFIDKNKLQHLAGNDKNQGVVAEIEGSIIAQPTSVEKILAAKINPWFLILDEVSDPHNLGACLRSGAAVGVDAVIVPNQNSAALNQIAIKVSSGGAMAVPIIRVANLARTLRLLKDNFITIYGTAGEAELDLYNINLRQQIDPRTQGLALVMGSEGNGLRRLTREHCDYLIKIPMEKGPVSSLNVSVAAAVNLFEFYRQLKLN